MKILQDRYPKGSLPGQQTDGRYIDEMLYDNLKVLAEVITNDMTFLGIVSSSTLEVGTGKSVFVQQLGEAWIHLMKDIHKIDLPLLSMHNLVFKPKDLIERAFKVPKYSVLILDEWEDAHYWSELGISLRQFFRKCRQLNLFMLAIIPNFFELPKTYAISRSVFFVDIRFEGKFERGHFRFFSFKKKKELYINGKKTYDYDCVKPDFAGRFTKGYVIPEDIYRAGKAKDLDEFEHKSKVPTRLIVEVEIYKKIKEVLPAIHDRELAKVFNRSERQLLRWRNNEVFLDNDVAFSPSSIIIPKASSENFEQLDEEAETT